ncbi:MAG: hypothetical protein FJ215_13685 [Ignavibacteria bacterium]|nr:hypothetical protein [Ignavibacteria bacterium]
MAEYCADGRYAIWRHWEETDHYEPKPGKVIGAGPDVAAKPHIGLLKSKWGFSAVIVGISDIQSAISAGFSYPQLVIAVDPNNYQGSEIDNAIANGTRYFYNDEPFTVSPWSKTQIETISNYYRARGVRYGIGEQCHWYRTILGDETSDAQYMRPRVDLMTYTNYKGFPCLGYVGPGVAPEDQRPMWDWMQGFCGGQFEIPWISLHQDEGEFNNLLGHASNLGKSRVSVYAPLANFYNLESFCYHAWLRGWLRRFVKRWADKYCCTTPQFYPETCEFSGERQFIGIFETFA